MNNIDYIHNQDYQLRDNILLELSQEKAINSNYVYDWTCETGEVNIKMGDEIMIYQSFLNVKGASNESINILDEEVNGNNPSKTPIEIQYYKCNDGLNSLPMPYAFQLLSLGTEEPNIDEINDTFYKAIDGSSSCLGSGMYVEGSCSRNVGGGTEMIIADLVKPIDCSRYTLMEQYIDNDAVYNEEPRIKHKIYTGTHTINLESNYYTPSNLCDNITKSITNPTLNNTIDEFDREIGIDITTPTFIKHKGMYRSRDNYGGLGTNNLYNAYITGSYLPKSVWGWDICQYVDSGGSEDILWRFNGDASGTDETDVKNGFPGVSEDWFKPAPSWDFYGGTDRFTIGTSYKSATPITDGTLSTHTNYYYKYPNTLIAGEELWNRPITQAIGLGSIGTIQTHYTYNHSNITKFHNLVNTALEEGAYDNIKVRNYNQSATGTSHITLNKETQRAVCIAKTIPNNVMFGTASHNYYYGFPTNKYGHQYGVDFAGFGSFTANYTGSNCWRLQDNVNHHSIFHGATQNTLGSYVNDIQLIKYDPTNTTGSGICVNHNGYIGLIVGTAEGGMIDNISGTDTHHIGWFPKHTDGLFNSAICHINPNGLGYKPFNRKIEGKISGTITTQIQPLKLTGTGVASLFPRTISYGSQLNNAKSHASSNPNVYCGAISPIFNFDTDLSRFTISKLHTPQYINNSVYASSGVPLTDAGSSVVYLNPVFQETQNQFIGKWENWGNNGAAGSNYRRPYGLKCYFNNADRNRNTFKKGVSIMDAKMGVYISKWANNDTEEAWDNTLWSKMGFSYETLHPPNNRHYRNEDYTIGTTITLSNPSTTNANFDVSLMNQLTTNMWSYPLYTIGACGEVLQREISAPSSEIVADKLPIKNELPYYIICSDILSYGGMNEYRQGGNTLPAIDICSLNYNSEDYYFAEPSQLTHIADKDLNINSVNIVVRRPDGRLATELSGKSSVILKISRNYTLPAIQIGNIGDTLQQLNKNTMKLPPQISGGVLGASGGTLMGGKITANAVNNFRALTSLGIMGETMEELQGLEPQLYSEMIEQSRENQANDIKIYEKLNKIQQINTILEAQIKSNKQTLRDYEKAKQDYSTEIAEEVRIGVRENKERLRQLRISRGEPVEQTDQERERELSYIRKEQIKLIEERNKNNAERIQAEIDTPNTPYMPQLTTYNNTNIPSTPNLQLQINYNQETEQLLEQEIEEGELSPSQIPLPFDIAVGTDNLNTSGNTLNTIDFDEDDDDEEYDPTLEPTQSNPQFTLTPEKKDEEVEELLNEDLEEEQKQREKEIREKDKEFREKITPKKELKKTESGTTGGISSVSGATKSSVFTTPSQLDEQRRQEEGQKKKSSEEDEV